MSRFTLSLGPGAAVPAVALLAIGAAIADRRPTGPARVWEVEVPGEVRDVAFAPDESCLALTTADRVMVIDTSGQIRWQVPFSTMGRFVDLQNVAPAPGCDWVAAAGSTAYRYVLIVTRDRVRWLPTLGTPAGIAARHDGTGAAVGTAAGALHFFDQNGRITDTRRFQSGILKQLRYSPADTQIAITRGAPLGLLSTAGAISWLADAGGDLAPSAGWERFVTWWQPPHFSTLGSVSGLDHKGAARWTMWVHYPSAAIAPDGAYSVVVGVPSDSTTPERPGPDPEANQFIVVSPDGTTLAQGACPGGEALAVSPDGSMFLTRERSGDPVEALVARSREGTRQWTLAIHPYGRVLVASDFSLIVVAAGGRLTSYR
jgi:hypothetical protein